MSRSWCTTLEESIVSEYLEGILNKKKKVRPPKSPYEISGHPPRGSGHPPRPQPLRPKSGAKSGDHRPKTACSLKNGKRSRKTRSRSGSLTSLSSLNSSQLSVYSANLQGSPSRHYSSKKIIKRVKLFNEPEISKVVVASSFSDLIERSHSHHLYTSDGTPVTGDIYHLLPHNCHLFVYDPTVPQSRPAAKPKIVWTKDGILVSGGAPKRTTTPLLSTRMQQLVDPRRQRVQVYRNGEHRGAGTVKEAALRNMLADASNALCFTVSALYTIEGTRITEGEPVPHIITTSHLKGPLWATKGNDTFSFLGAFNWCKEEHKSIKKEIKSNNQKLEKAYELEQEEDKITKITTRISDLQDVARNIRDITVNIAGDVVEEEDEGNNFRVKNIPQIKDNSRLMGRPNVKVNVSVNGKNAESRVVVIPGGTFKPTLDWFLEECERVHQSTLGGTTQKVSTLYDAEGNVVTNIINIEPDAQVFIGYGEPFCKPKIKYFLDISLNGVTAYKFPETDRNFLVKRMLEDDEISDPPKMFTISTGVPETYKLSDQLIKLKQKTLKFTLQDLAPRQIFEESTLLQHKTKPQRLVYPSLSWRERAPPAAAPTLISSQSWVYTKQHQLKPKGFPKLYLSVSNHLVVYKEGEEVLEGYMVCLSGDTSDTWECTKQGQFVSSRGGLYLTCLESPAEIASSNTITNSNPGFIKQSVRESGATFNGLFDMFSKTTEPVTALPGAPAGELPAAPAGEEPVIVVLPELSKPGPQRWGFKQENIALLGQWKLCNIANPEWAKECLSWPCHSDGTPNKDISWPMEGMLLAQAPGLQEPPSKASPGSKGGVMRLRVRYNGSCEPARHVTIPDLSNMKKDLAIKRRSVDKKPDRQPDTQKWLDKHSKLQSEAEDKEKVLELELRLFLDRCGSVLGLTTPPTRLYTSTGEELVTLQSLVRDDNIYVSCGAEYVSPDSEQGARNKYLHDVTHDINKIKTFCSAVAPTVYVASVSAVRRHETLRLQILNEGEVLPNEYDSMSDILQIAETNKSLEDIPQPEAPPSEASSRSQAFHFKSHTGQNEVDLGMIEQYPWRNPAFTSGLIKDKLDWAKANSSGESDAESDCESLKSVKSTSSTSSMRSRGGRDRVYNQWIYKDCRFMLLENPQYVLSCGVGNSVELVLYDKNSPEQCWTLDEGFIYSSNGQTLTVSQCSVTPPHPVDHAGSKLKLAPPTSVGNTSQKWKYDHNTGHLVAFADDPVSAAITAAIQTKICTYSVTSSDNSSQPTYIMENPGLAGIPDDNTHIYVCESCAIALRDRYSVDKIDPTSYVCSVGYYCSTAGLDMKSSLLALGGLDGLQQGKAFGTLYLWESLLADLKQQSSLKSIKEAVKQALQLECPNESLVLVRCYLNGTGPPRSSGAIFLANSCTDILAKCQAELKPGRPLSRIYLADGSEVANLSSLLEEQQPQSASSTASLTTSQPVPYKELFVSAGEEFIKPRRPRGTPSLRRRLKMYRDLSKLDVSSLVTSPARPVGSRPPHLPISKRSQPVFITRNGDFTSKAVRVVAHNLDSLLESATSRLNLAQAARKVYSSSGAEVTVWSEVVRDQALVISTGEAFIRRKVKRNKWIYRQLELQNEL